MKLATRPEKRVGTDEMWDHAEGILKKVPRQDAEAESGGPAIKTGINAGRGRPSTARNSNIQLKDAIGREWQMRHDCRSIIALPERFEAF